jgi:hypothetical protein
MRIVAVLSVLAVAFFAFNAVAPTSGGRMGAGAGIVHATTPTLAKDAPGSDDGGRA